MYTKSWKPSKIVDIPLLNSVKISKKWRKKRTSLKNASNECNAKWKALPMLKYNFEAI